MAQNTGRASSGAAGALFNWHATQFACGHQWAPLTFGENAGITAALGCPKAPQQPKMQLMSTFEQISEACKTAIPFLAMIYAAMLIYFDAPKDRSVYYKQGISIILYAVWAYMRVFGSLAPH